MIWLIGCKGMLGSELSQVFDRRCLAWVGSDRDVDITDPAALNSFIERQQEPITWIVNCAAYTAVDKAEDDTDACRRLNADGPAAIAGAANRIGARALHFSTDYVFNGRGTVPYKEDDPTDPIGVYGLTKRDGEEAILAGHGAVYLVRTAWLYGQHGNNFVHAMLRLMNGRKEVRVVNDQLGSPTWTNDLAAAAADLIARADGGETPGYGIYHYTNEGAVSWFEFAEEIYAQGKKLGLISGDCGVKPCSSADYPSRVVRPAYSVLDTEKIKRALGIAIPRWNTSLKRYLETCGP